MSTPIFFTPNVNLQKHFFTPEETKTLSRHRIIQKNLVHFQNFPDFLLNKELLSSKEYFGKYGKILKIVIVTKEDEITKKSQNSAYITFSNNKEAANAILNFDSILIGENLVRAFFGTSKYCIHFLNNLECFNKEKCMFIHQLANENDYLGVNSKFRYSEHIKLAKKIVKDNNSNNLNNNDKNLFSCLINSNINVNDKIVIPKRKSSNSSQNSNLSNNTLDTSAGSGIISSKCNDNLSLFKSKKQSRFFNNNNSNFNICNKINNNENCNNINKINTNEINYINIINIDISDNLKNIINNVLMRYGFFKRFDNYFTLNDLENNFCKKICKDDNFKFVFENIN